MNLLVPVGPPALLRTMSLTSASDTAFAKSRPPVKCWFAGGAWDGQSGLYHPDQHSLMTPKSSKGVASEYYKITQGAGTHLIPIFVARNMSPEEQREKIERVAIAALEEIIRAETAAKAQ